MDSPWRRMGRAMLPIPLLMLGMLWVPLAVWMDIRWLEHGVPELGVTEISQEVLLFVSALFWFHLARRRPAQRGFHLLAGALLLCMFLRELDGLLDLVWHGFWKLPVLTVLLLTAAWVWPVRQTVVPTMARFFVQAPFAYVLTGGLIVVLFSRLFGTSSFWIAVLDVSFESSNTSLVKNTVQEGLELLGYGLIFHGSLFCLLEEGREHRRGKRQAAFDATCDLDTAAPTAPRAWPAPRRFREAETQVTAGGSVNERV